MGSIPVRCTIISATSRPSTKPALLKICFLMFLESPVIDGVILTAELGRQVKIDRIRPFVCPQKTTCRG